MIYLIRNYVTQEATYFEPFGLIPYKGQTIVYGEARAHMIRVRVGEREVPGKPIAFPMLTADSWDVLAFRAVIEATGGEARLRISAAPSQVTPTSNIKLVESVEMPVLAIGRQMAEWWGGKPWVDTAKSIPNRDGLVGMACKVVDLYLDVKEKGVIPLWFIRERRACRDAASGGAPRLR